MSPTHRKTVAVLGTGTIGAPVARNLIKSFAAVHVWNRTRAKAEPLTAEGAKIFDDAADAVDGADIVLTVLKDGPAVLEAMTAAAPGLAKGVIWIQLSTVGVSAAEELLAFARQHELVYYDAPVQGTKQPAENGQLVVLAAGPGSRRQDAQTVFDVIGGRTLWVSTEAAAASRLKLALNSLVFAITHGTAESLALAEALGVDPRLVLDVVTGGPLDSAFFQGKAAAILAGEYAPSFSVDNSIKDSRLMAEAAARVGIEADVTVAGLRRFERAAQAGHGDKDMAASYLAR